jgi:hypothetical protein
MIPPTFPIVIPRIYSAHDSYKVRMLVHSVNALPTSSMSVRRQLLTSAR